MGLSFHAFPRVAHFRFFGPSRTLTPDPRLREHERTVEDALESFRVERREIFSEGSSTETRAGDSGAR